MSRLLLIAVVVTACSTQTPGTAAPDSLDLAAAAATITSADVYDRVAFLASDSLRGRDTPSPGLEEAARWIAAEWAGFGLEPAGDEGWFQRYPYPATRLDRAATELAVVSGATHFFEYGVDFFATAGRRVSDAVGAVYVGAELPATAALADRAVIVSLDARPRASRWGFGFDREARRRIRALAERAGAAGAAAVVYVLDAGIDPAEIGRLAVEAEEPSRTLGGPAEDVLPRFYLSRPATERVFRTAGLAATLLDRQVLERPVPLPGVTLRLGAPGRAIDDARPPNVVGLLPGSDPELSDQYVVLTAHFDHVGIGAPDEAGDSIYNGADDDASGTSVLVEVAEAMARLDRRPARSLLFLAVSGEEKGLLGSRWFADHPTVPLEKIVANINLDMIGRNAPDTIVAIGLEYSSLGATLLDLAAELPELRLTVSEDLWPEERFYFRSDHFSFARKEIPALFFFSGVHEDYHGPGDEVERLDTDKTARVGRLVFYLVHDVANATEPPRWHPEGLETVRRLAR